MSIEARVQNFQSIKDATVVLDGFTVVTGQNNSGKSAFVRAIKGVFTNAAPGPLVRHGEAHLTVTLRFDDGSTVKWEKGWEKPGQKGGTVNRYTINGKVYDKVGSSPPEELYQLLQVGPVEVGTQKLWPQIADQFDGVLFLVGSTGSNIAEAVADVERVGKINSALRLAESDNRSTRSKLKVRREDLKESKDRVASFSDLDTHLATVSAIQEQSVRLQEIHNHLTQVKGIRSRMSTVKESLDALEGLSTIDLPERDTVARVEKVRNALGRSRSLHTRLSQALQETAFLEGVGSVPLPGKEATEATKALRERIRKMGDLRVRVRQAQQAVSRMEGVQEVALPDMARALKVKNTLDKTRVLQSRISQASQEVENLGESLNQTQSKLLEVKRGIKEMIGDKGECPLCGAVTQEGCHG